MAPSDTSRLLRLFRAHHPCIWIQTVEEAEALALIRQTARAAELDFHLWTILCGLHDGHTALHPQCDKESMQALPALVEVSARTDRAAFAFCDLTDHLGDGRTLRALREAIGAVERTGGHLILIDHAAELPPPIRAYATPFELSMPEAPELQAIIKRTVRKAHAVRPIDARVDQRTLDVMTKNLGGLTRRQAERVVRDAIAHEGRFTADELNIIIAHKRQLLSGGGVLEYVESPVSLDAIGGLEHLKAWLRARAEALTDEARDFGLSPPRGVLMLGVQGAGKSLCAKAIATAWGRPLVRLDPGALFDRYIGESERRLREALAQAEAMAPIVLWIDEIEKGFASAASHSVDGGLSQRMFGSLLTWMQEHRSPVFLVATANDIEALPPELLRKGRFDEIFFVDLPGPEARAQIFRIHLSKRGRDPGAFDLDSLTAASEGRSGSEIEQAVIAGLHAAFEGGGKGRSLTTADILAALEASPPLSVTMAEKIAWLRAWARDRCVQAG